MEYQPLSSLSREQRRQFFQQQWGNPTMAFRGKLINLLDCHGIIASHHQPILGMVTLAVIHNRFEILPLDSLKPNQGSSSYLLTLAEQEAKRLSFHHCQLSYQTITLTHWNFIKKEVIS